MKLLNLKYKCDAILAWHEILYISIKANTMAKSSRGRSQDRSKVAGGQDYEIQYEKEKTGASKEQIKKAIKTEGNQRKK